MKRVSILGATGSVGTSTLDLIERAPDAFEVEALTAHRDVNKLAAAARRVGAKLAVVGDEACLPALRDALGDSGIEAAGGEQAVIDAAARAVDWTMAAIVGTAGLKPVMAALARGGAVALANKEALVSAGEVMMAAATRAGTTLLPVDSEHNAVFQCLDDCPPERIRLLGIDAPELPGHCRRGRQCVEGDPYASKAALAALIARGPATIARRRHDRYGRTLARVRVNGVDLSEVIQPLPWGQITSL